MTGAPQLERSIRFLSATAMVVGTIIGASIFVQPSVMTARVPSVAGVLVAWLAAGALTLLGALVCAELAAAFPRSGGVYVFLRESCGGAVGFLWGWAMFWSMHTGIIAAIAMVCGRYLDHLVPMGPLGVKAAAVTAILLLTAVNYGGVGPGSRVQTVLTLIKVTAVVAIVTVLFGLGAPMGAHFATGAMPAAGSAAHRLGLAVGAGLFAFGGWHMVTYAGDETVDAARTIPRALLLGTLLVTACYIALNAAYLFVLPLEAVAASRSVAADAATAVLGAGGGKAVSLIVVVSTLGAVNGIILTGPRVYYAMAGDGLLFRWFATVHPRFHTPSRAILLQGIWACVLVLTGTYEELFGRVIYTEWIFFAVMATGLLLLRRRSDWRPPFRLAGGAALPLVFIAASLAVAANQIVSAKKDSAIGLAVVLAGLPVYALWTRARRRAGGAP